MQFTNLYSASDLAIALPTYCSSNQRRTGRKGAPWEVIARVSSCKHACRRGACSRHGLLHGRRGPRAEPKRTLRVPHATARLARCFCALRAVQAARVVCKLAQDAEACAQPQGADDADAAAGQSSAVSLIPAKRLKPDYACVVQSRTWETKRSRSPELAHFMTRSLQTCAPS